MVPMTTLRGEGRKNGYFPTVYTSKRTPQKKSDTYQTRRGKEKLGPKQEIGMEETLDGVFIWVIPEGEGIPLLGTLRTRKKSREGRGCPGPGGEAKKTKPHHVDKRGPILRNTSYGHSRQKKKKKHPPPTPNPKKKQKKPNPTNNQIEKSPKEKTREIIP